MGGRITIFNMTQYATTTFDNVLIALAQGPSSLGLYDKAYQIITQPIGFLLLPINRVAIPILVRFLPETDRYKRTYLRIVQITLIVSVPALIYILIMANALTLILLGPRWSGIAPVVAWLCIGGFASLIYNSTFWLFVTQERIKEQLRYGLLTSFVSIVSFAAGLPWGPAGVAAGAGLSFFFFSTPITCWAATKSGPVKIGDLVFAILPIFVSSLATAIIVSAASYWVLSPGLGVIILGFLLCYGVFLFVLFLTRGGRQILSDTWSLHSVFISDPMGRNQANI
jgi:PST family polysaccharide transporter